MHAARQGLPGFPHRLDGRINRDPSGADAAAAHPCHGDPDLRPRAGAGQMVQPLARLRLPDLRRGYAGYLRAHGDAAPLRHDRAAPGTICAGPLWAGFQGHDGGGNPPRNRAVGAVLALSARDASSKRRFTSLFEHGLFRKPGPTLRDHALFPDAIVRAVAPGEPLALAVTAGLGWPSPVVG